MKNPSTGNFLPLGFHPFGDWGPFTIYTSRTGKIVRFPRSPPKQPPTWGQQRQRDAWSAAMAEWASAPDATRTWWRQLARLNRLNITAINLFLIYKLSPQSPWLASLKNPA
jgi:hypothetical protein